MSEERPGICEVHGCNKKQKKGSKICSMHSARLWRTGKLDKVTLEERLQKCYEINPKNGCWEWIKPLNEWGYGRIGIGKKNYLAHRLSYILFVGEIPEGLLVCHHCDNPKCINPKHLFVGTSKDNGEDKAKKGRSSRCWLGKFGEEHPSSRYYNKRMLKNMESSQREV